MNSNMTWTDVMGNDVTAQQAMAQFEAERRDGETLAEWMERTAAEMWANDDMSGIDWNAMARQLERQAAQGMTAEQAVQILAHSTDSDKRSKAVTTLAAAVNLESEYGDPDDSLMDWISAGDYSGSETVESIAADWDERD